MSFSISSAIPLRNRVPFNAVLDVSFSDQGLSQGGAQVLNLTDTGLSFQNDLLIGATLYLLFIDGIQYTRVTAFSVPAVKEFKFDDVTGAVTVSITITAPITIFYWSPATPLVPGVEPVTVAEAKTYMKYDIPGSLEDTLIADLIITAREQCEDFTGISIVNRTVTTVINNSCGGIFLPYCPFISLTSIKDKDGEVIATDDYILSGTMFPQLITPCWDRLTLVYTAGYGISPQRIKTAILQQTFFLYENRGNEAVMSRTGVIEVTLSPQARSTLQRIRRV